jgi:hypothetical protein
LIGFETLVEQECRQGEKKRNLLIFEVFGRGEYSMMKLTIAFIFAFLSTTAVYAAIYNYSCRACLFPSDGNACDVVDGKTYPLRVDDSKNVLEWRGKKYSLTEKPDCGRWGWHAEGNGTSFDFCTATQGYGAIETKDEVRVQCDLKR